MGRLNRSSILLLLIAAMAFAQELAPIHPRDRVFRPTDLARMLQSRDQIAQAQEQVRTDASMLTEVAKQLQNLKPDSISPETVAGLLKNDAVLDFLTSPAMLAQLRNPELRDMVDRFRRNLSNRPDQEKFAKALLQDKELVRKLAERAQQFAEVPPPLKDALEPRVATPPSPAAESWQQRLAQNPTFQDLAKNAQRGEQVEQQLLDPKVQDGLLQDERLRSLFRENLLPQPSPPSGTAGRSQNAGGQNAGSQGADGQAGGGQGAGGSGVGRLPDLTMRPSSLFGPASSDGNLSSGLFGQIQESLAKRISPALLGDGSDRVLDGNDPPIPPDFPSRRHLIDTPGSDLAGQPGDSLALNPAGNAGSETNPHSESATNPSRPSGPSVNLQTDEQGGLLGSVSSGLDGLLTRAEKWWEGDPRAREQAALRAQRMREAGGDSFGWLPRFSVSNAVGDGPMLVAPSASVFASGNPIAAFQAAGTSTAVSLLWLVVLVGGTAAAAYLAWWLLKARRTQNEVRSLLRQALGGGRASSATILKIRQLFEYTAVSLLGDWARNRHHRDIAGEISRQSGEPAAANGLADLYEIVRYQPPGEPLPADAGRQATLHAARLLGTDAPIADESPTDLRAQELNEG